jgi:hypothetical protein
MAHRVVSFTDSVAKFFHEDGYMAEAAFKAKVSRADFRPLRADFRLLPGYLGQCCVGGTTRSLISIG